MNDTLQSWAGPSVTPSTDELAERYAIEQLANTYALGMDMRDYALARSAFSDNAVGLGKNGPEPVDDYLKATYAVAESFHATQHMIGNQTICLKGDEAELWSYGVAHHKLAPGAAGTEIIAGVQYRDKCKKTAAGWLIVERSVQPLWVDQRVIDSGNMQGVDNKP